MCELCLTSPCHPRCPNAEEPKSIHTCTMCGEGIFDGDKFLDGIDGIICEECADDLSLDELLAQIGEELRTA